VAEGNGLLNRHTPQGVSRVRIPPSPPRTVETKAFFDTFDRALVYTPRTSIRGARLGQWRPTSSRCDQEARLDTFPGSAGREAGRPPVDGGAFKRSNSGDRRASAISTLLVRRRGFEPEGLLKLVLVLFNQPDVAGKFGRGK
jgi:hypothetical protein